MLGVTPICRFVSQSRLLRCIIEATQVYSLDPFSKSRVLQFLKRVQSPKIDDKIFRCERIEAKSGGGGSGEEAKGSFVCRVKLFDDSALGEVEAVGIAACAQNAQLAAAMHAERLIDSSGRCLYALPSMQRRHAIDVSAQGRWAPLDGKDTSCAVKARSDLPRPLWACNPNEEGAVPAQAAKLEFSRVDAPQIPLQSTAPAPSPAPKRSLIKSQDELDKMSTIDRRRYLRRIAERAPANAKSRKDETEGGVYQLCNTNTHRVPMCSSMLQSPAIVDPHSIVRARVWYEVVTCGSTLDSAMSNPLPVEYDGQTAFVMQVDLGPAMSKFWKSLEPAGASLSRPVGPVIASGKASTVERATILLGMHAELLLDHWGIVVDPRANDEAKKVRRQTLIDFGRGFGTADVGLPQPKPLKELSALFNEFQVAALRFAPLSDEEKFIRYHGEAFNYAKSLIEVNAVDDGFAIPGFDTMSEAKTALADLMRLCRMRAGFLVTTDCSDTFRCTLVLNNWSRVIELSGDRDATKIDAGPPDISDLVNPTRNSDPAYAALGIGPSQEVAENLCVMHAIELLTRHNAKLFPLDQAKQDAFMAERRKLQLYVPAVYGIAPPPQERLLHRNRRSEDRTGFQTKLALSGPSFIHSYRRNSAPPPYEEEMQIRLLSPLHDFSPVDDEAMTTFANLYVNRVQEYLSESRQRLPDKLVRQRHNKFVPHVIVQEQGSSWRHRTTAWFHVRVPTRHDKRRYKTVTAIGQGTRVKEAERACFVHLVLMLRHHGIVLFDIDDKLKKEKELFQAINRPLAESPPQAGSSTGAKSKVHSKVHWTVDTLGEGYSDTTIRVEVDPLCPPVIVAEQQRLIQRHRKAFDVIYAQLKAHGQAVELAHDDDEEGEDDDDGEEGAKVNATSSDSLTH